MKTLKWGILSTGKIAHRFATDIQFADNAEVAAVASRSMEKARTFAAEFDIPKYYGSYEDLCQDPEVEAVYIGTPHNFHLENSLLAIENGKPVLCEKPVTISPDELEKLIAAAEQQHVFLMEGMWTYFLPAVTTAKKWVDEGRVGKIRHVKAEFGFSVPFDPDGRLYNPDLAGGVLYDMGIYPIAITWLILGKKPKSIELYSHIASTGVDDDVFCTFHYDEYYAHLHASFRAKLGNRALIMGEKGTIEIPDFWEAGEAILYDGREVIDHYHDPRNGRGFEYQITKVSEDIMNGKTESEVVPFSTSRYFQEQIDAILKKVIH